MEAVRVEAVRVEVLAGGGCSSALLSGCDSEIALQLLAGGGAL